MKQLQTFSFGGGVQSTAALVLAAQGKINYRIFLFANVGEDSENPLTLRYVENYANAYAEDNQIELRWLERRKRTGEVETLYGRLTKPGSRSLPIPVRMSNGAPGMRACTSDFKIAIISKWLKQHGATKDSPAITGLGISVDEWHRARTDSGIAHQCLEYPLIDLRLTRQDCMNIIRDAGLPVPPKSSCYFCPFHSRANWQELKREQPELFQKSVDLELLLNERRAELGKDEIYLHNSCRPLDQAVGDQIPLFDSLDDNCESGYCFT